SRPPALRTFTFAVLSGIGARCSSLCDRDGTPGRHRCHGEGLRVMNAQDRVSTHFSLNERVVFEEGAVGRRAFDLPSLDVPAKDVRQLIEPALLRDDIPGMPELSEVDVIRHFTRLSTWNYHIDLGLYPLGSCTMKYNPKINERMARLEGFTLAHPYMPAERI